MSSVVIPIEVLKEPVCQPQATSSASVAIPGDPVSSSQDGMRGHGTYLDTESENVLASVAGNIERINKLVSVKPLRARYRPEVGDLVIGRIMEVGQGRWKVDCRGRLDASLALASVNLPGGVQRRKLESDELQMRTFFSEGDLLVAEVQSLSVDGAISLHTRSLKYGKLRNGRLVTVSPSLIVRLKSHFHSLPCGVSLIIGLNGSVWVYATPMSASASKRDKILQDVAFGDTFRGTRASGDVQMMEGDDDDETERQDEAEMALRVYSSVNDHPLPTSTLQAIARVAAVITLLSDYNIPLTEPVITQAYDASLEANQSDMKTDNQTSLSFTKHAKEQILASIGVDTF